MIVHYNRTPRSGSHWYTVCPVHPTRSSTASSRLNAQTLSWAKQWAVVACAVQQKACNYAMALTEREICKGCCCEYLKSCPAVVMISDAVFLLCSLWDMTEDTIGVHYGQYADMRQAAVVVGTTVGEGLGG
eukprot:17942-Heterococcus_DN1.PRE.4